jgi:SAM-dependent methyltransferase
VTESTLVPAGLTPYERALRAYHFEGHKNAVLVVHSDTGDHDEMPVEVFFRDPERFFSFEEAALEACRGRVLELGAGTGSDALYLQAAGMDVVAVDLVPSAVEIMRERGVLDARRGDWRALEPGRFDTLLTLMNGVGWTGTLKGLDELLRWALLHLGPRGQFVLDGGPPQGDRAKNDEMEWPPRTGEHPGETWIRLEFEGELGEPFQELYLDFETLADRATRAGWFAQRIYGGEQDSFVARLTPV